MSLSALLSQLNGIKETGRGKYVARCPAHEDRSPSLAIKDLGDGRILVNCFAGCETADVLTSVGLTFADLMPERIGSHHSLRPLGFDARQILATLDHESLVVAIIAADIHENREVDDPTWTRLTQAVQRINTARAIASPLRHRK